MVNTPATAADIRRQTYPHPGEGLTHAHTYIAPQSRPGDPAAAQQAQRLLDDLHLGPAGVLCTPVLDTADAQTLAQARDQHRQHSADMLQLWGARLGVSTDCVGIRRRGWHLGWQYLGPECDPVQCFNVARLAVGELQRAGLCSGQAALQWLHYVGPLSPHAVHMAGSQGQCKWLDAE